MYFPHVKEKGNSGQVSAETRDWYSNDFMRVHIFMCRYRRCSVLYLIAGAGYSKIENLTVVSY